MTTEIIKSLSPHLVPKKWCSHCKDWFHNIADVKCIEKTDKCRYCAKKQVFIQS